MEVNALTRWTSIGADLFKLGKPGAQPQGNTQPPEAKGAANLPTDEQVVADEAAAADLGDALTRNRDKRRVRREADARSISYLTYYSFQRGAADIYLRVEVRRGPLAYLYRTIRRFLKGFLIGYAGQLFFSMVKNLARYKGVLWKVWMGMMKDAFDYNSTVSYGIFLGGFLAVFEVIMRYMAPRRRFYSVKKSNSDTTDTNKNNKNSSEAKGNTLQPPLHRSASFSESETVFSPEQPEHDKDVPKPSPTSSTRERMVHAVRQRARHAQPYPTHSDSDSDRPRRSKRPGWPLRALVAARRGVGAVGRVGWRAVRGTPWLVRRAVLRPVGRAVDVTLGWVPGGRWAQASVQAWNRRLAQRLYLSWDQLLDRLAGIHDQRVAAQNGHASAEAGSTCDGAAAAHREQRRMAVHQRRWRHWLILHRIRPVVAALVAGLMLRVLPYSARVSISLFFFVRAVEILVKFLRRRGLLPGIPHADTMLMAVASMQVIWAWLHEAKSLDPAYRRFLDVHGAKNRGVRVNHRHVFDGMGKHYHPPKDLAVLNRWRAEHGYAPYRNAMGLPDAYYAMCELIHPETNSCTEHWFWFFLAGIRRAFSVYLPIYAIPLLLFRSSSLLSRPLRTLIPATVGLLRSSVFLGCYCATCWLAGCFGCRLGFSSSWISGLAGAAGGSCVLLEKKQRRVELALYVTAQAIQSAYRILARGYPGRGYGSGRAWIHSWVRLPYYPSFSIWLFSLSMAVVMQAFILDPKLMRSSYASLLSYFFGSGSRWARFNRPVDPPTKKKQTDGAGEGSVAHAQPR